MNVRFKRIAPGRDIEVDLAEEWGWRRGWRVRWFEMGDEAVIPYGTTLSTFR